MWIGRQAAGWTRTSPRRPAGGGAGDGDQVRGQHTPADPTLDPSGAVVRAARQPVLSLEHTDAPLDSRSPAIAALVPALALPHPTGCSRRAGMRQRHTAGSERRGLAPDSSRRAATVTRD